MSIFLRRRAGTFRQDRALWYAVSIFLRRRAGTFRHDRVLWYAVSIFLRRRAWAFRQHSGCFRASGGKGGQGCLYAGKDGGDVCLDSSEIRQLHAIILEHNVHPGEFLHAVGFADAAFQQIALHRPLEITLRHRHQNPSRQPSRCVAHRRKRTALMSIFLRRMAVRFRQGGCIFLLRMAVTFRQGGCRPDHPAVPEMPQRTPSATG